MCLTSETQQNEMIKNEVQHTMKGISCIILYNIIILCIELVESDIDNTQDSELLSTSMESMECMFIIVM